jgi:hypothetical protein
MNQNCSSKIYFYFLGALGQAVHQAVSKKRPKCPKLDIPFLFKVASYHLTDFFAFYK